MNNNRFMEMATAKQEPKLKKVTIIGATMNATNTCVKLLFKDGTEANIATAMTQRIKGIFRALGQTKEGIKGLSRATNNMNDAEAINLCCPISLECIYSETVSIKDNGETGTYENYVFSPEEIVVFKAKKELQRRQEESTKSKSSTRKKPSATPMNHTPEDDE